jgi:hypothetical protein
MPGKDGTGPVGNGKGGRMGGPVSAGPEGMCVCPTCGTQVKHDRARPCSSMKCPKCGSLMIRA